MAHEHDVALRDAWVDFCEQLKGAADLILSEHVPDSELDRAAGFRYLTQEIGKAFNEYLEFADPLFPQFWVLQRPTSKSFGDNPDCTYLVALIDGSHTYRIVGNRGTVEWVRFGLRHLDDDGERYPATAPATMVTDKDLDVDWDGSFSMTLSPEPQHGTWVETKPGLIRIFVRQFFGDWSKETPMSIRIERVGSDGEAPAALTADRMVRALRHAGQFLIDDPARWHQFTEHYRQWPHEFISTPPPFITNPQQLHGRLLNVCYFEIPAGKALLLEFMPPRCTMWIMELSNYWMNSTDYRYHFSSLNSSQAAVDDDGVVRIAVSSDDPGIANWLDPAGHENGLLICRWVDGDPADDVTPTARLVSIADISDLLPRTELRSREQRADELRERKIGVDRRFGYAQ